MSGSTSVGRAFRREATKLAADAKKKPGMVEAPPSPVAMENMALTEQLENLQLHMQLDQARNAFSALQQQKAMAAAGGQDGQQNGQPAALNPFYANPATAATAGQTGLPSSPTEMIGAQ